MHLNRAVSRQIAAIRANQSMTINQSHYVTLTSNAVHVSVPFYGSWLSFPMNYVLLKIQKNVANQVARSWSTMAQIRESPYVSN